MTSLPLWWRVAGALQLAVVAIAGSILLLLIDALSRTPTLTDIAINMAGPLLLAATLIVTGTMLRRRGLARAGTLVLFAPAALVCALFSFTNIA